MKKTCALLLVFLMALTWVPFAAAETAYEPELSASQLKRGDPLTISGAAPDGVSAVVIKIITPNRTVLYIDVVPVSGGRYSADVTIPDTPELAPYGTYRVVSGSGEWSAVGTFAIPNPNAGSGSGGGPAAQSDTAGIPAQSGERSGAVVQPEADGERYIIGAATISDAIRDADGAVTVELPAAAGVAGAALEMPASALSELAEGNADLIITVGHYTLRFPAGGIVDYAGEEARFRIVLRTAWDDEARRAVEQAIRSHPDYSAAGVVLSAVIEIVEGDRVVSVQQLMKPAIVSIQLTEEQSRNISSDLAGVYYVGTGEPAYIRGNLENGVFTFMAEHFSYYAILEYDKSFADMAGHWAEAFVKRLAARHIVSGVDDRHYEPDRSITRAEFVSLLMRAMAWAEALPAGKAANPFTDVPAGRYYTGHVAKAAALGIVSGYGGAFRPDDTITREEAAAALVRAATYFNLSNAATFGEPNFADMDEIADWAAVSVTEAWSMGLVRGDGVHFHPKKTLTRAEMAVMISGLLSESRHPVEGRN